MEKPTFKHPFQHHRCVIPVSGFYEWQKLETGKQPFFVLSTKPKDALNLGGIFDFWTNPATGEEMTTFSIITTDANEKMQVIHDRMPLILQDKDLHTWLDLETQTDTLLQMLRPAPKDLIQMFSVSRAVNSPANNYPDLLNPITLNVA